MSDEEKKPKIKNEKREDDQRQSEQRQNDPEVNDNTTNRGVLQRSTAEARERVQRQSEQISEPQLNLTTVEQLQQQPLDMALHGQSTSQNQNQNPQPSSSTADQNEVVRYIVSNLPTAEPLRSADINNMHGERQVIVIMKRERNSQFNPFLLPLQRLSMQGYETLKVGRDPTRVRCPVCKRDVLTMVIQEPKHPKCLICFLLCTIPCCCW